MANPYHDAEGRFCSRGEMVAAVNTAALANDYTLYSQLKSDLEAADQKKTLKTFLFGAPKNPVKPEEFVPRVVQEPVKEELLHYEGYVDVENITDESYKLYGFDEVTENWDVQGSKVSYNESRDESMKAVKSLTKLEKKVLVNYTYNDHEFINRDLRPGALIEPSDPDLELTVKDIINDEDGNPWALGHKTLKVYCKKMDNVFAKNAGGKPQKVYRGVPFDWEDQADDWVAENAVTGKVLSFPEYLSTSVDLKVAREFAHPSRKVVMEIVTNQGLNVTAISYVSEEKEVLLPRDMKYVVVGVQNHAASDTLVLQMLPVDENNHTLGSDYVHKPSPVPEPYISWERHIEAD